jgi:ribosomal protein S18 acetylase RimI-like enzyme
MNEFIELGRLSGQAVGAVMAGAPGLHTRFTENCAVIFSGEPYPAMNMIFAGLGAETEDVLLTSAALACRRGHPALALITQEAPAGASALASTCGYTLAGQMPLMVLRKDALSGAVHICELVPAVDDALVSRAIALRSAGRYSIESMKRTVNPSMIVDPTVEIFVGISHGDAVSTVTVTASGDTAGIWFMATAKSHRRQGIGRSLLSQAIALYRNRGIERFYLSATDAGKAMYASLGFQTIGTWEIWLSSLNAKQGTPAGGR